MYEFALYERQFAMMGKHQSKQKNIQNAYHTSGSMTDQLSRKDHSDVVEFPRVHKGTVTSMAVLPLATNCALLGTSDGVSK